MKYVLILFFSLVAITSFCQNYKPVNEGSKVHFTIKNFGISTGGDVSGLQGAITFTPGNIANCNFNVSVDIKTIDTDSENRDEHLKSADYFDAEKFPLSTLTSTRITKSGNSYIFTGNITIHGVTKGISFPFDATLKGNDYLFAGNFTINRLDFGVGKSSGVLSNIVKVSLSVLARKN